MRHHQLFSNISFLVGFLERAGDDIRKGSFLSTVCYTAVQTISAYSNDISDRIQNLPILNPKGKM